MRAVRILRTIFFRHTVLACSAGLLLVLVATALLCPWLAHHDPLAIELDRIKLPPGSEHWFGTDTLGRDIFSRVVWGCRYSLAIGLSATVLALLVGLLTGLAAGYWRGKLDALFVVTTDIFLAFPTLLLAVGISVVLPPGAVSTVIALCATGWASFARLFRSMAMSLNEQAFVDSARAAGCSHLRIIFSHILPHCLPLALVSASIKVGSFILAEAALGFLGLGVQPPMPTWGSMISLHRAYLASAPWMILFPGAAIALTVYACNVFGDELRDRLDPGLRV